MRALFSLGQGRRERGDTIVEVMFAIAVLGSVLGTAYVVIGRNVKTNQASQERSAAVKVAESQLERLKVKVAADPDVLLISNFCMNDSNLTSLAGTAACKLDGGSNPTTEEPGYAVVITNLNGIAVGSDSRAGAKYKITVSWASLVNNTGNDSLDYFYEAYK